MATTAVDVLKGTLDLMILRGLSWGPAHGYAVSRWIRRVTEDTLQIEEGALYPALHRLERRGWVSAAWGLSENNRRAKYYRLTKKGRAQLRVEASSWARFTDALGKILTTTQAPATAKSP